MQKQILYIHILGEPYVYLKPVEQILYSATVPIKKRELAMQKRIPYIHILSLCLLRERARVRTRSCLLTLSLSIVFRLDRQAGAAEFFPTV